MVVTTKQNKPELKVSIDNNPIKQSHHIKYLGVLIDDNLNWKQQIKEQCSKVARGSWALNQLKHFVDEQTLSSFYLCLIYSHLQYCISSWGTASKSTLAPLFILQKRSIRLLTGSGYREQRWSRRHKARGQGQGHKKNPRPRTAFPRTDTLEAKAKDQGHKRKCSQKKKGLHKNFSGDLQKKKRSSQKFFKRSPRKNVFQKNFQALHKILTIQKYCCPRAEDRPVFKDLRPRGKGQGHQNVSSRTPPLIVSILILCSIKLND